MRPPVTNAVRPVKFARVIEEYLLSQNLRDGLKVSVKHPHKYRVVLEEYPCFLEFMSLPQRVS